MGWIKFSYFSEHADLGGVWLLLGLLNRRFAPHNPSAEKLLGRLAVHRLRKEREPANQIVARFALTKHRWIRGESASLSPLFDRLSTWERRNRPMSERCESLI